jgi:hypothetical protein
MWLTQACNCVADRRAGRVHYCRVNCRFVARGRCDPSIASPRQLSKVLRTKRGLRQWIAAPKSPRAISNGSVQNHDRWIGSNPGQRASPMRFSRPVLPRRAWRALRPSCTPSCALALTTVSASLLTATTCPDRLAVGAKQRRQIADRANSACTTFLSPSNLAFSTFKSARAFSSTVSLSAMLLRLACRRSSSAARSLEIGGVPKVAAPN